MVHAADNRGCRTLIFGGTFDPPHLAHATLPPLAAHQLGCEEILYIPAALNPLKGGDLEPTSKEHRLAMLVLAIADVPGARISTIELDRRGKSYTIDTLRALAKASKRQTMKTPRQVFHLLIGCDQALDFHRWKDWRDILKLATPAVMVRPPWDPATFERELRAKYSAAEATRWLRWTLNLPLMDVSATRVRRRLRRGESVDGMLHPAVAAYIRANRLYA